MKVLGAFFFLLIFAVSLSTPSLLLSQETGLPAEALALPEPPAKRGLAEAGSSRSSFDEAGDSASIAQIQEATKSNQQTETPPPEEQTETLEAVLRAQDPGPRLTNPLKHAVRNAAGAGIPLDTIVLLLLLPVVASIISAARHLIGLRGFGILLPAALSIVFIAIGPVTGIALFLVIVAASVLARLALRKMKLRLQYLPRMALILWLVVLAVLGVLFAAPLLGRQELINVSIFPVLFLILLAEDFTRVQIGKSIGVAVNLTSETLILALVSFIILSFDAVQYFALLNPELLLILVAVFNFFLGKYVGLRLLEIWRFRKLITK